MFELECPKCGHTLRIRSEYLGKQGRCKHCQGVVNVEVTTRHKDGRTLLHDAAMKGDIETAKLLITHGANINAKDKSDYTPLHAAVFCGQQDVADLLMAKGARADFANIAIKPPKLAQDSDISEIPGLMHQGSSWMGYVDQVSPSKTPTKDSTQKNPNEQQFSWGRVFAFTAFPLAFCCVAMFRLWLDNNETESLEQTTGTPINTAMPVPQPQLEQPTIPVRPDPYLEEHSCPK